MYDMDQEQLAQLGRSVTAARLRRGMGKEPAARDIEVSSITLKRVEDGKPVREDSLAKILRYFDLPMPGIEAPTVEPIQTSDVDRMRRLIEQSDVSPELRKRLLDALPKGGDGYGETAPTSEVDRRAEGA